MPSAEFTVYKGSADKKVVKGTTRRELGPEDVVVKITHSGLCYTDVHMRGSDMVLGHEGVGIVEKLGPACKTLKIGDHVGWGYVRDTCGICNQCLEGDDMYCEKGHHYGVTDFDLGSFASHCVIREPFLVTIPDAVDLLYAGPLMCGGATVWEALTRFDVRSTDRVGILGVGGLGHLAIQFANKLGCEVVVFSSTDSKKDEAISMGAHEFYATKGVDKLELKNGKKINHLLVTTSAQADWSQFVPILEKKANVFPLTVDPMGALNFPCFPLNAGCFRIQGSAVAPRRNFRKMLDFAALHQIRPVIMEFPMSVEGIEEAFQKLEDGKMRYRAVLVGEQ